MNVKTRIFSMVGVGCAAVLVCTGLGWYSLHQAAIEVNQSFNEQFLELVDTDLDPLLTKEVAPLVNEDIAHLDRLQQSIAGMLEADAAVQRTVIAEKMSLVAADGTEMESVAGAHAKSLAQVGQELDEALAAFPAEMQSLVEECRNAYSQWKQRTEKVLAQARVPAKLKYARKASDGGSAYQAYQTLGKTLGSQAVTLRELVGRFRTS